MTGNDLYSPLVDARYRFGKRVGVSLSGCVVLLIARKTPYFAINAQNAVFFVLFSHNSKTATLNLTNF